MMKQNVLLPVAVKRYLCHAADPYFKETDYLSLRKYGPVGMIGLNRPQKRNAVNESMVNDLKNALNDFEKDETVGIGVIHGEGGNFCSGYDLEELAKDENIPDNFVYNDLTTKFFRKPLIAAVNGYAVGFGFDLALWCDLRVMDETAVFGCFGRRFGASMSECGIARLNSIIGVSRAMDLLMTGRGIRSQEALAYGLANRIVSCGTAIGQALNLASSITKFPLAGILTDRAILYKHAFAKIPLKNTVVDEDSMLYREQVAADIKKGARLFKKGAGKEGKLFPYYLWNSN